MSGGETRLITYKGVSKSNWLHCFSFNSMRVKQDQFKCMPHFPVFTCKEHEKPSLNFSPFHKFVLLCVGPSHKIKVKFIQGLSKSEKAKGIYCFSISTIFCLQPLPVFFQLTLLFTNSYHITIHINIQNMWKIVKPVLW